MTISTRELLKCLGDPKFVYISVPITSGLTYRILTRNGQELTKKDREVFVIGPNVEAANALATRLTDEGDEFLVLNPAQLSVNGWEDHDYMGFWVTLLTENRPNVIMARNWQYSKGCQQEYLLALRLGLRVFSEVEDEDMLPRGAIKLLDASIKNLKDWGLDYSDLVAYKVEVEKHV